MIPTPSRYDHTAYPDKNRRGAPGGRGVGIGIGYYPPKKSRRNYTYVNKYQKHYVYLLTSTRKYGIITYSIV